MRTAMKLLALSSLIFLWSLTACDKKRPIDQRPDTGAPETDKSIVEGTINGGGGKGVLCTKNGVSRLEILDLYEAQAYGLKLLPVPKSEDEALDLAIEKLARQMWTPGTISLEKVKPVLKKLLQEKFLSRIRFIDNGKKLRAIDDAHSVITEKGCREVQIAVYYEAAILIDKAFWDQLDNLNRAAMWMHELLYLNERQAGRTNSISTRIVVGQMFSSKGSRPISDGIPADENAYVRCSLRDDKIDAGSAYAFLGTSLTGERGVEFVFHFLKSTSSLTHTSAFFSHMTLEDLENEKKMSGEHFSTLEVDSSADQRELNLRRDESILRMRIRDGRTDKTMDLLVNCTPRSSPPPPPPPDRPNLSPNPPAVPTRVELRSRYDGVGTYETTATYNFRFMSHDVELTRNNWDLLFEARKDFKEDMFDVNTVTDDVSYIFDLGDTACDKADPCVIGKHLADAKRDRAKGQRTDERIDVHKGHCYLLDSFDRDGAVTALFRVAEHEKSVSAVLTEIKVLNPENVKACGQ